MVPHYFNTEENIDYLGHMPDISYYAMDEMSGGERKEFLAWYERQKSEPLYNKKRTRSVLSG